MAETQEDQEKSEPATPRRLEKAREEGQVARSRELTTWLLLLAGVASLWSLGTRFYGQLGLVMEQSFLFERQQVFEDGPMLSHVYEQGGRALMALLPLFLLMVMVAIAAPLLLGGWLFSAKSLQPKFSKLNPVKGLKRIFSSQALVELAKVLAKVLLLGLVGALFMLSHLREFMALMHQSIQAALAHTVSYAAGACGLMVLTLIGVVLIDVPYQLWSHFKKLRMSKEEVKKEHKESDGDPLVKAKIRSQQQAMARKRMMNKIGDADVVVTNPTHYAVALQYLEGRMAAPRVVAKGAGAVAQAIRERAAGHKIPMLEAPPLARALYRHVDLEQEVPGELYTAVAEVLAWAFALKRAQRSGSAVPEKPSALQVPDGMDMVAGSGAAQVQP